MKFSIRDFFSKCADLVTFTEETLNGKLHFFCAVVVNRKCKQKLDFLLENEENEPFL